MTATGWCEDCGDVEVRPRIFLSLFSSENNIIYADCPICLGDVDQWAWA